MQPDISFKTLDLPEDKYHKQAEIFAAQKIIADISSGLYRSPAAALKELVSNAYDADAEIVTISTDVPRFRTLVVRDNGKGMTIDKFLSVMKHIGGSRKRIQNGDTTEKGRKIIGRIGIGMLAVAQLGFRFYVTSSVRGEASRFIAEVDLEPFHKDDAALQSMGRLQEDKDEVRIGAIRYVDGIPEDERVQYTAITIPDAKQGLKSEVSSAVREAIGAEEELAASENEIESFREVAEATRSTKRADTALDGYYYMLWELALLSPINYLDKGPFETDHRSIENIEEAKIPEIKEFKVLVDGIELRRPQLFPSQSAFYYPSIAPKVYPLSFDREIAKRRLRFHGYVYAQKPRVDPEEFRGVHIRIRNVGIGSYDRTWLGYPFDEGYKFGQVTGEVYVDDGLESALNIDRDSFRETDVHYQALRAFLWDKLRRDVFPDIKSRQREFTAEKKAQEQTEQEDKLVNYLSELSTPLLVKDERFVTVLENPSVSDWIRIDMEHLDIDKNRWEEFVTETGLTRKGAKDRFIRVLKILISTEVLSDISEEEIESLLRALSIAVQ